ncbi:hypothetical protein LSUE1_G002407 [Lachnellula suecica]|uniref:DUF4185 domain-containing protein n=1 Tax=Lachnellula suecica TaxID=602035 RepID=A0A8T9C9A8_9HELO|nr:hypothetical protein LSUE1_G002407 [Lachnellula suecica]
MATPSWRKFILFVLKLLVSGNTSLPHPAALPPVVQSSSPPTNAILKGMPWPIQRDGGGGGTVAGQHIINFSDTSTLNEDDKKKAGYYPFVSNTIVTTSAMLRQLGFQDGKTLTDYGSDGFAKQQWPFDGTETSTAGRRVGIWPDTNIVSACDGQCGYTVSSVVDISRIPPYHPTDLYSTLAKITIGADGPSVERVVPRMWYANEINYGLYGLARARDDSDDIFMFGAPKGAFGIKVARVAEDSIRDRSKYIFWNGKEWATTSPAANDASANIFNYRSGDYGVGTGDVFWSNYYNTWLAVFNDEFTVDDTFKLMYSTNGAITGPWSTVAQNVTVTPGCSGSDCAVSYNYNSHAYPDIDTTGKTLLLGWIYNGTTTQFTTITFK